MPTTRSRSKSPSVLPPSKPTYATLTSRRRSAARDRRSSVSLSPAPPATATSKAEKRSSRPSEILPPLNPVNIDGSEEEEDELLLLPPERGRGKGEGKEGAWRKWERERKARSMSVSVKEEAIDRREEVVESEQNEEQEDEDFGGYDAGEQMFDAGGEEDQGGETIEGDGQNEPVDVNFGTEDEGEDDGEEMRTGESEAGEEMQATEEQRGDDQEEDQKDFLPLQDPVSDEDNNEQEQQDEDLPFADQPLYSPSRSSSSHPRDETPPLQEGQSYLQIFPPLSPNTTGEFDDVEPLRFSETPAPPDISLEDQTQEDGEAAEERQLEPPSPFLSRLELSQQQQVLRSPSQSDETLETVEQASTAIKPEELGPLSVPPAASLLSPSTFIQRTPARARSLTPTIPVASPQRAQFNFVPLPSPRTRARQQFSHSPFTARARQPSPLAPVPTSEAGWTRGPAFFRSSSFTPPPVRSSFDRKGKGKAVNQDEDLEQQREEDGEGEEEQSREYWNPGEMTATSPHVPEKDQQQQVTNGEDDEEEDEEGEDEISFIRQPSRSVSVEENAPPTPVKDHLSTSSPVHQDDVHDSDASMRSPVSIRSHHSSASPPRSPNGDMIMSSPVHSLHSRSRSQSASSASSTYSTNKKLPATPPPIAEVVDEEMLSPSPARTQFLRKSPSKLEELMEAGKGKLTGLLSFASSPRASTSQSIQVQAATSTPIPSTSKVQFPAPQTAHKVDETEQQEEADEDDEDRPFPLATTRPAQAHESTFTSSHLSFANSTTSRSRRHIQNRSSHSSFPVIEISSTDAKAAARAAAILKVYHKYVEQGIEGGLARDEASRIVRDAERKGLEAEAEEANVEEESEEEEEELRTLLFDAEEEVRETFGAARENSVRFVEQGHQDEEEEEEEVRSVVLSSSSSNRSHSPSTSQHAQPSLAASQAHSRSRSVSNDSASGLSSVVGEKWTSQEWRRLEQSLVELKRKIRSRSENREPGSEEVVEAFLHKWGVQKEECKGDWEW